jgi:hypothetical protein
MNHRGIPAAAAVAAAHAAYTHCCHGVRDAVAIAQQHVMVVVPLLVPQPICLHQCTINVLRVVGTGSVLHCTC